MAKSGEAFPLAKTHPVGYKYHEPLILDDNATDVLRSLTQSIVLLLALASVSTLSHGSLLDSLVDCTMKDALKYVRKHSKDFYNTSVESFARSCPFSLQKTRVDDVPAYVLYTCFNVTELTMSTPMNVGEKVEIGRAKLNVSVQVKTGSPLEAKVNLTALVLEDAYVYLLAHTTSNISHLPIHFPSSPSQSVYCHFDNALNSLDFYRRLSASRTTGGRADAGNEVLFPVRWAAGYVVGCMQLPVEHESKEVRRTKLAKAENRRSELLVCMTLRALEAVDAATPARRRRIGGFSVDSIIDCLTTDLLEYVNKNGGDFNVIDIKGLVRSCPLSFQTATFQGVSLYVFHICFNVTGLVLAPPSGFPQLVAIGHAKLDAFLRVVKQDLIWTKFYLEAPVFDGAYAYVSLFPLPPGLLRSMIKGDDKKLFAHASGIPIPATAFKTEIINRLSLNPSEPHHLIGPTLMEQSLRSRLSRTLVTVAAGQTASQTPSHPRHIQQPISLERALHFQHLPDLQWCSAVCELDGIYHSIERDEIARVLKYLQRCEVIHCCIVRSSQVAGGATTSQPAQNCVKGLCLLQAQLTTQFTVRHLRRSSANLADLEATELRVAARHGWMELIQWLVGEEDADVLAGMTAGQTAFEFATKSKHRGLIRCLPPRVVNRELKPIDGEVGTPRLRRTRSVSLADARAPQRQTQAFAKLSDPLRRRSGHFNQLSTSGEHPIYLDVCEAATSRLLITPSQLSSTSPIHTVAALRTKPSTSSLGRYSLPPICPNRRTLPPHLGHPTLPFPSRQFSTTRVGISLNCQ
ncbi:hypothetical protein TcWFU_010385 [Taenia crassiceps]|uniref:Uncharacterized protein n=1 Tax=Taenia crassiceps TaxID=6207 RepID=A0ABR4QBV1_9CEST